MKTKRNNPFWGIAALLSSVALAVAFFIPCVPAVMASAAVLFVSCLVLGSRFFDKVGKAFKERPPFSDDYGYL